MLLISIAAAYSQQPVKDTRTTYSIGVAEFSTSGLAPENVYIGSSYPLLIFERFSRIEEHLFDDVSIAGYRKNLLSDERKNLIIRRDRALARRDAAYLSGNEKTVESEESKLDEIARSLEDLDKTVPESIAVPGTKPVEMITQGDQLLLPEVKQDVEDFAAAKNLDLLIFGTVEEIESYLFVEVYVYSAATNSTTSMNAGFSRERLTESSSELFDELVTLALGREWATLTINAKPEEAEIYVDDVFRGLGSATLEFFPPGSHEVRVFAYGFEEQVSVVDLASGSDISVEADLPIADSAGTRLSTVPTGADVYARSQWQGKTPVILPPGLSNVQGIIRLEDHADFLLPVLPQDTTDVQIELVPTILDRRVLMDNQRDDFYTVLAAFILSLPLPIYFFDATNTLTLTYLNEAAQPPSELNYQEAIRILSLRQMSLSAYIGTFFISAALLTDAVIELLKFMDLVDLSTF